MPEAVVPRIGQLSGTARPVGIMRGILGSATRERALGEWKEFYAHVLCDHSLKALVENKTISRSQYLKVVKAVAAGLHTEFVPVNR